MKKTENNLFEPVKKYFNSELDKSVIISENKNKSGVYRWVNNKNGNTYVGSAIDLSKRIGSYYHKGESNKNFRPIRNALDKYGHDKFSLEILEYCDKKDLITLEQYYLDKLIPEYNILKQAYSLKGFKHSKETIEKLKLKTLTKKQKEFLSDVNKNKTISDDTRNKLSYSLREYHKNNPLTPEALENITRKTSKREGVRVFITDIETSEKHQFETKTAAGKFLGVTRQAIHNSLVRDKFIKNKYKVSMENILDDSNSLG